MVQSTNELSPSSKIEAWIRKLGSARALSVKCTGTPSDCVETDLNTESMQPPREGENQRANLLRRQFRRQVSVRAERLPLRCRRRMLEKEHAAQHGGTDVYNRKERMRQRN